MIEKEIKILDINIKKVIRLLEKHGATKTFKWEIKDIYFDYHKINKKKHYKNANVSMEKEWRLFRIRKKWKTVLFTIKKKVKHSKIKVAHEKELPITCYKSFSRVLKKYWLTKTREKTKKRISYYKSGIEFDIDTYKWMPTLLEIEAKNNKQINKWIKRLKLKDHKKKKFWSRRLFDYYWLKYKIK